MHDSNLVAPGKIPEQAECFFREVVEIHGSYIERVSARALASMYWRGASFIPYFLMRLELPDLSNIVGAWTML